MHGGGSGQDDFMTVVLYILIGVLSGALTGLGIGGGTILIPALTLVLGMEQHAAQSINLIYFIPTAVVAIFTHAKNGNIEKKIILKLIIFGVISAAAGSFIAVRLDGEPLRKLFGYFLLLMGCVEFFRKEQTS